MKKRKSFGQHFLIRDDIAEDIVNSLVVKQQEGNVVVEVGPGEGVLTKFLVTKKPLIDLYLIELDNRLPKYLIRKFPELEGRITNADVLKVDLAKILPKLDDVYIIGNFPYNISTQIVFKMLEMRNQIPEFSGMFQKEVAQRICSKEGSKVYGILSVLTQAFYDAEYLFTVLPSVFNPPPKVDSGVLRLVRKENYNLPCDESLLFKVVKTAFQQRRKTLRNSLKTFNLSESLREDAIFDKRPEQLNVQEFIYLTQLIQKDV